MHFAQAKLLDLPGRGQRKAVDHSNESRDLELRQARAAKRPHLFSINRRPWMQAEGRGHILSEEFAGHRIHGCIGDRRVSAQHVLDFLRRDVLAATQIMSLIRPVIRARPWLSIEAWSPLRSHPSGVIAADVASGIS